MLTRMRSLSFSSHEASSFVSGPYPSTMGYPMTHWILYLEQYVSNPLWFVTLLLRCSAVSELINNCGMGLMQGDDETIVHATVLMTADTTNWFEKLVRLDPSATVSGGLTGSEMEEPFIRPDGTTYSGVSVLLFCKIKDDSVNILPIPTCTSCAPHTAMHPHCPPPIDPSADRSVFCPCSHFDVVVLA